MNLFPASLVVLTFIFPSQNFNVLLHLGICIFKEDIWRRLAPAQGMNHPLEKVRVKGGTFSRGGAAA